MGWVCGCVWEWGEVGGGGVGFVNINTCFREGTGPSLKYDCWGGVEGVGGVWSGGLGVGGGSCYKGYLL